MDKWEILNLQTIRRIKPSILDVTLSYRDGLDPFAASYLVGWIEKTRDVLARLYLNT